MNIFVISNSILPKAEDDFQPAIAQGTGAGDRVARLMRLRGLRAKQTKLYKTTTKRNKRHPVAPNLLKRDFVAEQPNQKWLTDITYIPTQEGWLSPALSPYGGRRK